MPTDADDRRSSPAALRNRNPILAVLREGGIEMKAGSFRNFVASYRKQRAAHVSTPTQPSRGIAVASVSYDTGTVPAAAPRTPAVAPAKHVPPTPQELHAILHPDPVKQAEEMAEYARIAREAARAKRLAQKQNAG